MLKHTLKRQTNPLLRNVLLLKDLLMGDCGGGLQCSGEAAVLLETPVGQMLLRRIRTREWIALGKDDVLDKWKKFACDATEATILRIQREVMGIKRSRDNPNKCLNCGKEGGDTRFQKCSICLRAKYCSLRCQKADWRKHKDACVPPRPKVSHKLVFVLPDSALARAYFEWYGQRSGGLQMTDDVELVLEERQAYEHTYGPDAVTRCLLSLAIHGRPSPRICSMLYETHDPTNRRDGKEPKVILYRGEPPTRI